MLSIELTRSSCFPTGGSAMEIFEDEDVDL